jgi:hypothetical protein
MALPREIPYPKNVTVELASAGDRAGPYTIEELRQLLGPVLGTSHAIEGSKKWPALYNVAFVVTSSAILWALMIAGLSRLISWH